MKKLVRLLSLVLVLLLAVCVFVACNDTPDDGPDDGKTPPSTDDSGDGSGDGSSGGGAGQTFVVTIKFTDSEGNRLEKDIVRDKNITYNTDFTKYLPSTYVNNKTKFKDYVLIGWDTDGDKEPDEGYKKITGNLTINAVFRPKTDVTVKFYDTPTHFTEVKVREGEAIDTSSVTITPQIGRMFKQWVKADTANNTTLACADTDASFVAQYAIIDSVIPMVSKSTITVDGKKEDAWKNATYLPINEEKYADLETGVIAEQKAVRPTEKDGKIPVTGEDSSWITADAWLLWDGSYIYMLVEVSDKTLTYRNPYYLSLNNNPWLNDTVEAYFNFEQTSIATQNKNKVAMDAFSQKLFSNSIAVYGQRSTNFDDMDGAARSALGYFKTGGQTPIEPDATLTTDQTALEGTDDVGVQFDRNATKNYSYRIELKFVAKTEGVPDKENYNVDDNGRLVAGTIMPDGETVEDLKTDADKQDPIKTDKKYYKFTEGKALAAGSFVRFNLQITDLMISADQLANETSGFYEGNPRDPEQMRLGSVFDTNGKAFFPPYVPCGHTQYDLSRYVAFSLGGEGSVAKWEVYELKGSTTATSKMYGADGATEVEQGKQLVTVEIAK